MTQAVLEFVKMFKDKIKVMRESTHDARKVEVITTDITKD